MASFLSCVTHTWVYKLSYPYVSELGTTLKGDPNIIIAKMDATANHPPKYFQYQGFPTIFWVGMDQKVSDEIS